MAFSFEVLLRCKNIHFETKYFFSNFDQRRRRPKMTTQQVLSVPSTTRATSTRRTTTAPSELTRRLRQRRRRRRSDDHRQPRPRPRRRRRLTPVRRRRAPRATKTTLTWSMPCCNKLASCPSRAPLKLKLISVTALKKSDIFDKKLSALQFEACFSSVLGSLLIVVGSSNWRFCKTVTWSVISIFYLSLNSIYCQFWNVKQIAICKVSNDDCLPNSYFFYL